MALAALKSAKRELTIPSLGEASPQYAALVARKDELNAQRATTGAEGREPVARKPQVPPGAQTMSNPTPSIGRDREIGNVFDDLKPTREPGVSSSEHRIEPVVAGKGEPDGIRPFRQRA